MQDFNVDFTKKTKRTLQAIEREKSCSSNNQVSNYPVLMLAYLVFAAALLGHCR